MINYKTKLSTRLQSLLFVVALAVTSMAGAAQTLLYDYNNDPIVSQNLVYADTRYSAGVPITLSAVNVQCCSTPLVNGFVNPPFINGIGNFNQPDTWRGLPTTGSFISVDISAILSRNPTSLAILVFDPIDRFRPIIPDVTTPNEQFAIPFGSTSPLVLGTRLNPTNTTTFSNQSYVTGIDYSFENAQAGNGTQETLLFDATQLNALRNNNFNFLNIMGGYKIVDTGSGPTPSVYFGVYFETLTASVPVPEPATYAVLIACLGVVALAKSRRRAH